MSDRKKKHIADGHDWKSCECKICVGKRRVTGLDPPIHNTVRTLGVDLNEGIDGRKTDGH